MAKRAETLSPCPVFAGTAKRDIRSKLPKKIRAKRKVKRNSEVWPHPMAKTIEGPAKGAILRRRRAVFSV
jgi:hypothetical protein